MTVTMTLFGAAEPAAARTCMIAGDSGNDPAAESLMDLTVKASRSGGYAGIVWVEIHGQGGTRSGALSVVHAGAGHLVIEARDPLGPATGALLVQAGKSRSVVRIGAGSIDRGRTVLMDDIEPESNLQQMLGKYRVLLEGGVRVLQRDAKVVRIERIADDRLVERWTIDATSGLLLKRESYNAASPGLPRRRRSGGSRPASCPGRRGPSACRRPCRRATG
jgi:hypothetical protein